MTTSRIMLVGDDDTPAAVALGIAVECHRQNALALKGDAKRKDQADSAARAYEAITGQKPHKRKLSQSVPEYGE